MIKGAIHMLKWLVLTLVIVMALTTWYLWDIYTEPVDLGSNVITIMLKAGDTFSSVADTLYTKGVVRSGRVLKYQSRLWGLDKHLAPGRYDFTGRQSYESVLRKFRDADIVRIRVTVPEGATIWSVASILSEKLKVDSSAILALNSNRPFLDSLGLPSLEGYLFPETYIFDWGTSLREAIVHMIRQWEIETAGLWRGEFPNKLTVHEIMVMASIIESETRLSSERKLVSSVYHNRLRKKMKLDADPTVIYGLGGLDRKLSKADLKLETPYNTYRKRGLPPTPINSPGLESIRAALAPMQTEFLFFVADKNGGHYFGKTNEEHNLNRLRARTE
jgi:UPF0755 protein